jgi:hypothetical protein
MHQQRSGFVPVNLAFSASQTLGSWQMGQRVGSMVSIYFFEVCHSLFKFTSIPFAASAIGRKGFKLVLNLYTVQSYSTQRLRFKALAPAYRLVILEELSNEM